MGWPAVLTIAAVLGSISCVENFNNFGSRLQAGNFNSLYNKFPNFGSIQQPSGHWHYSDDDEDEADDDFEIETTQQFDEDEETDSDLEVDSNNANFVDNDEQDETDQDFGLDEIQFDARRNNSIDVLSSLPALKKSLLSSLVNKQIQGTTDTQTIHNSSISSFDTTNDLTGENSSNSGIFEESFDEDFSQLRGQTQSGDISNLFGGLLKTAIPTILSNGLNKENLGQSLGGSSSQNKLTGDISNLIAGLLGSSIPKSTLSNGLNRGISKIGNIRNSVLDFRDRALDQRVGTVQSNELNQFDPRFQASLSNPNNRGSTGVDQLTWNKLRNLVNQFQKSSPAAHRNEEGAKSVKSGLFGLLGSAKGLVTSTNGREDISGDDSGRVLNKDRNQSVKSGLFGLLGNAATSSSNKRRDNVDDDNNNDDSNRGGRFQFLTNAKNFVTNPVDYVERKIRNKIKQKIKNEIKQSVGDITNRVGQFKSNMTSLAGGLAESFKPKLSDTTTRKCLKILTSPQAHQLYLNGKHIPEARILYVDKLYPLDFNSCPINHQDEVLKNCLVKGNVLVLSQPDKVKVEEEHGRQLEMIIAKDVVKDRLNGMVDTFFQNFGRQILKGVQIFRGNNND